MSRKNSLAWTAEQVDAHNGKVNRDRRYKPRATVPADAQVSKIVDCTHLVTPELAKLQRQDASMKKFQALGRLPKGRMNKTEAAYAEELERQRILGLVNGYRFHPMRIRLADNTFYEVDFLVLDREMRLAIHETKGGFTTDKGQMKIKVCAETLPWFRFFKVTKLTVKQGGGWKIEEFNA